MRLLKSPLLLVTATAVSVLVGVGAISFPALRAWIADARTAIDRGKSMEVLVEEAAKNLEGEWRIHNDAVSNRDDLDLQRKALVAQRAERVKELGEHRRLLVAVRETLDDKTDDTILVAQRFRMRRDDVEQDLRIYLEKVQSDEAEIAQFDKAIAGLEAGLDEVNAAIAEAAKRLNEDTSRLQELRLKVKGAAIQERIRRLVNRATPEAILTAQEREFKRKERIIEGRLRELPQPRPVTRGPWREVVLGESPEKDLLEEVDDYITNTNGGQNAL